MRTISLYVEKNTPVHRLEPVTKLWYAFTSVILTFLFPSMWMGLLFLLISLIIAVLARVLKNMVGFVSAVLVVSTTMLIIQGMFYQGNATLIFTLGKLSFYKEGFLHATVLIIRVINMIIAFGMLILTTRPSDMVSNLVQKGLSPKLGYILSSVLQIIPQMLSTASTIIDAQRSRGLETEGSLMQKLRAFFALIGPLVLSSLVEARERAIAIEMRGFGVSKKPTFVKIIPETMLDKSIKLIMKSTLIFAIAWRVISWITI
ncbi:energy-coupling factor transporter transmembrane component T family protein [Fervidobacterium islandicum]|uniref:energy-coupling factor transporter transmembrane component T family protein n=1 Tax=Fervidobacterium islandicum TaxID=2423 RepID=UPI003A651FEF